MHVRVSSGWWYTQVGWSRRVTTRRHSTARRELDPLLPRDHCLRANLDHRRSSTSKLSLIKYSSTPRSGENNRFHDLFHDHGSTTHIYWIEPSFVSCHLIVNFPNFRFDHRSVNEESRYYSMSLSQWTTCFILSTIWWVNSFVLPELPTSCKHQHNTAKCN